MEYSRSSFPRKISIDEEQEVNLGDIDERIEDEDDENDYDDDVFTNDQVILTGPNLEKSSENFPE